MTAAFKKYPNILVTGTPGVGKSTLCSIIAQHTGFRWFDVSKVAKETGCLEEYDEEYQCPVLDEDKLLDHLDKIITESSGGNIVDYHGCDFFPERWFDIVFVVRASNTTIYDRLTQRGYTGKKLEDNVQCEIFQTILEEAQSAYKPEIVHQLRGDNQQDLEDNSQRIMAWVKQWVEDRGME